MTWDRPGVGPDAPRSVIRVGTRGSELARTQCRWFLDRLSERYPALNIELKIISTTGDHRTDVPLSKIGGKGLFSKEIDDALLHGHVGIAVHSLKDLPAELVMGLKLSAVPLREDPRDAWIHKAGTSWADAPAGTRIGTGSLRRGCIIRSLRPDLEVVPIRGNVDTRVRKLNEGDALDAIIVATAGLSRLGRAEEITERLDPTVFVPSPGQGSLGILSRELDAHMSTLLAGLNHPDSRNAAEAERAFLRIVEGDCTVPVAAHATVDAGNIHIRCLLGTPDGKQVVTLEKEGFTSMSPQVGEEAGRELLEAGGAEILQAIRGG
jgi:hydroxymethylbilane synthase